MLMTPERACEHGQVFDNRKRWCEVCDKTVNPYAPTELPLGNMFGRACPECAALWPEYMESFLAEAQEMLGTDDILPQETRH